MGLSIMSRLVSELKFSLLCRFPRVPYALIPILTTLFKDDEQSRPTPPAENALINEIIREYVISNVKTAPPNFIHSPAGISNTTASFTLWMSCAVKRGCHDRL
jgi:hypothetical protein